MKEQVLQYLSRQQPISLPQLLFHLTIALILGLLVFLTYRMTHLGFRYSRKFGISLVLAALAAALLMTAASENIGVSLMILALLSMVRFPVSRQDPREAAFLLWALVSGICCGLSLYLVAAVGSAFLSVVLLLLGSGQDSGSRLLHIQADRSAEGHIEDAVNRYFRKAELRSKHSTTQDVTYIYAMTGKTMAQAHRRNAKLITETLYAIDGVTMVNLTSQDSPEGC